MTALHGRRAQAWSRAALAAGHPDEVTAGVRMLEAGGNAMDAIVAAALAAFVVEPTNAGLAGYGHLSAFLPGRGFLTIDHGPRVPNGADPAMFEVDETGGGDQYAWPQVAGRANEVGHLSPAVPGAVAGLAAAHGEAGRLPWADVVQPAIELAEAGIEVTWHTLLMIAQRLEEIRAMPDAAEILLRNGDPPAATGDSRGERLDTAALAATLRRIAQDGPGGFHQGEVAAAIERAARAGGGILTAADLVAYRPKLIWERPHRYRDLEYVTSNDQVGYEVLNILDRFPVGDLDAPRFLHLMGEAFGHAFVDNAAYFGDTDHVHSPLEGLASRGFAAARADGISLDRAALRPLQAGDPWAHDPGAGPPPPGRSSGGVRGTTQVAVVDAEGMMASLITTIGNDFGSLVYVPEAGVFLNNSMANFDPRPDRPNSIAPGKMPFFAVPAIVAARDGRSVFAAAGSGGYRILSGVVHAFVHAVDFHMDVGEAVEAPRAYCQGDELFVDGRVAPSVVTGLRELGHRVVPEWAIPGHSPFARVSAVMAKDGVLTSASDPAWSGADGGC